MPSVDFYYVNGQTRHFGPNIRVSGPTDKDGKWLGKFYVWPAGRHIRGTNPIFSVSLSELNSKKKNGRKGINITKY